MDGTLVGMGLVTRLRAALSLRAAVVVPVVLALALGLLLGAGLLLRERAGAAGLARVPDTGPPLVGAELPADGTAGPLTVTLAPAATAHPRAEDIRALVQRSMEARNAGDYDAWSETVDAPGTGRAEFAETVGSQVVGTVVLRRIDPVRGGEIVVPTGLVTTQEPADAPPDVPVPRLCWQISLVVADGTPLRLADQRPGSALRTPC